MSIKFPYIERGAQRYRIARSKTFNIDNGSGTTDDDVILANLSTNIKLISIQAVYTQATDSSGAASANFCVGTTAGGTEIVDTTALAVSKAVGDVTATVLAAYDVLAGASLFARHTGLLSEGGEYWLQVIYLPNP